MAWVATVIGLFVGWSAAVACAGSGMKIALPGPRAAGSPPTVNGLTLALDCEWSDGRGYRPTKVDVTSTPPAAADRTLEIELSVSAWPARNGTTVSFDLDIPAGAAGATKVVSVPVFGTMRYLTLDVWEDGVHLDDVSLKDVALPGAVFGGFGQGELPSVLFVTPKPLNLSQFSFLMTDANYRNNATLFSNSATVATFIERAPADLVENWINYSSLDVIFLSLSDAQNLAATRPKVWQALAEWTWSGGSLSIYGVGQDWHGLAALEQLLQCPASEAEAELPFRGWDRPQAEMYHRRMVYGTGAELPYDEAVEAAADATEAAGAGEPVDTSDVDPEPVEVDPSAPPPPRKPVKKLQPPKESPFVWKEVKFGRVVAIANPNPFPGNRRDWEWMFNTITPACWKWRFRHGVSLDYDNPGFDNFLIAEVGLPPIRTYRVLITLFVVVIGPLNYWLLRRNGRLHLLLFTVPAAALLATGGLLAYVFVADGLQSRIRARSFTELDQQTHEAVSWARLSYYAGLAPSGGLLFGSDTAVLPLEKSPRGDSFGGRRRELAWTPEQHLTRGWLAARTPTQYVTVRAYPSQRELSVATTDSQHYTATNRLGANIRQVLVCDDAGRLHLGEQIESQGRAALTPLATEEQIEPAITEFLKELKRDAPSFPPQVPTELGTSTGIFPNVRNMRFAWQIQGDYHTTSTSMLETALARAGSRLAAREFKPRTYLAIVEHPDDVPFGTGGLLELQSLHVISGSW